ncbi:hypothetical protein TWF696_005403 [Orbilia brochopaga]|uniref:Uncharacterized protein n=1 Tax=Orbilia brochopaga TaxID=3140254 RepID=A0AAV9V309_9PEZI
MSAPGPNPQRPAASGTSPPGQPQPSQGSRDRPQQQQNRSQPQQQNQPQTRLQNQFQAPPPQAPPLQQQPQQPQQQQQQQQTQPQPQTQQQPVQGPRNPSSSQPVQQAQTTQQLSSDKPAEKPEVPDVRSHVPDRPGSHSDTPEYTYTHAAGGTSVAVSDTIDENGSGEEFEFQDPYLPRAALADCMCVYCIALEEEEQSSRPSEEPADEVEKKEDEPSNSASANSPKQDENGSEAPTASEQPPQPQDEVQPQSLPEVSSGLDGPRQSQSQTPQTAAPSGQPGPVEATSHPTALVQQNARTSPNRIPDGFLTHDSHVQSPASPILSPSSVVPPISRRRALMHLLRTRDINATSNEVAILRESRWGKDRMIGRVIDNVPDGMFEDAPDWGRPMFRITDWYPSPDGPQTPNIDLDRDPQPPQVQNQPHIPQQQPSVGQLVHPSGQSQPVLPQQQQQQQPQIQQPQIQRPQKQRPQMQQRQMQHPQTQQQQQMRYQPQTQQPLPQTQPQQMQSPLTQHPQMQQSEMHDQPRTQPQTQQSQLQQVQQQAQAPRMTRPRPPPPPSVSNADDEDGRRSPRQDQGSPEDNGLWPDVSPAHAPDPRGNTGHQYGNGSALVMPNQQDSIDRRNQVAVQGAGQIAQDGIRAQGEAVVAQPLRSQEVDRTAAAEGEQRMAAANQGLQREIAAREQKLADLKQEIRMLKEAVREAAQREKQERRMELVNLYRKRIGFVPFVQEPPELPAAGVIVHDSDEHEGGELEGAEQ